MQDMNESGRHQLMFADDTALVVDGEEWLQELARVFGCVCKKKKKSFCVGGHGCVWIGS